jgi:hypothetical protein
MPAFPLPTDMPAEPVPGYRLVRLRGRGGFGEVWEAVGPGGFPVALKFVELGGRVGESELRALEVIKGIRHAHLLATFGAWQVAGRLIIAVELADKTLFDRFQESIAAGCQGIPGPELREYMREAAKGLDYLSEPQHCWDGQDRAGIQHRDIKPQNLLLLGGTVKVADFGLARVFEGVVASHSGALTPAYAAPEFFEERTTPWSDQYSLAVTYCHLRGGRLPFTGNLAALMAAHLSKEPDLTMLPKEERPAAARALAKDPSNRWPSCQEFVNALGDSARHDESARPAPREVVTAVPQTTRDPARPTASRDERFRLKSLPDSLRKCVRKELAEGEEVQWAGQPRSGRFALRALPIALVGIFFTGFALFWVASALEMQERRAEFDRQWNAQRDRMGGAPSSPSTTTGFSVEDVFPLLGIPFVVVGLGMACSPLWMIHKARTTAYLVTNRRAIIFDGGWSTHVRSFGPSELGRLERRQKADGSGDVILAKETRYTAGYYSGSPGRGGHWAPGGLSIKEIGFFGIPQVKFVEQLLQDLAAGRKGAGTCGPESATS